MKLSYDPRYNIAYIRLRSKSSEVESLKISDELILDIDTDSTIYGIELLNANEQLREEEKLSLVNEATAKKQVFSFLSDLAI